MIACFDIGGSAIKAARAASPAELTVLGSRPTPLDDFDAFAGTLATMIEEADLPEGAPAALSITGVVDPATGRIKVANIPCIDGRALAGDLAVRLARPVTVANDADCFALAEAMEGAGAGRRVVFGAILGTGVGGGLVIDGRLLQGAGGFAGEWGHGPIAANRAGTPPVEVPRLPCGCGQTGCVDTVGGARGLERLHRHLHGAERTSREITDGWIAGDAAAARTIDVWTDLVADPLALVVNIVGADVVPVGGGLSNVHALVERLDAVVRARILRRTQAPLVVPARCHHEPGLIGAAILALREDADAAA
ncbi:ROK family protein [Aureimonas sp. Leaf324]|jgi:N-acetylglucosamine kinase|uniref:ROK family protein n=1 Tax=Aureimonas sp. Leaf324 TaxID=1736336 RepID=UPI000701FC18|nr:ROK family protein [Aureimonas sp. Leaf324]KQQ90284.1 N-acetylglucosamine kinase [Aureimonas sp. Leaf324]